MKTVNITLDGRRVTVDQGATLLDVAKSHGVDIPALCFDPRLPPYASCFVCIVEVEGRRGMAPACATKAEEGMSVRTDSENIRKLRKAGLELLVSNHPGDCVAPCNMTCPAGIDVRAYLSETARGNYDAALRVIKERNPFPSVCGRICPHPCEDECRRRLADEAVSINQVKRFVADRDRLSKAAWKPEVLPPNGKKAAVIGGGPGGLSAAYYLVQLGYGVTVFENMPKAGGMLRYGVPDYRLPPDVLDSEIEQILGLGVELRAGKAWGKDFHLDDLRAQGFSAIIVAVGAWAGQPMGVEGEDRPGVWSGIALLERANKGEKPDLGRRVVVVGGGNTAMDCARTALRLGAGEVTVVYRRSLKEMPAAPEEIREAEEEGVKFRFLTAPVGFPGSGKITSMRCVTMALGEPDASGRRRPVPVPGSETDIQADTVIAAIGQKVRWDGFNADGLKLTKWGTPDADPDTLQSSGAKDVFICGDCFTGPATAIAAIGAGRTAALSAHNFISGAKLDPAPHPYNIRKGATADLAPADYAHHPKKARAEMPHIDAAARARTYDEVSLTLSEEKAVEEASRCILCGCQDVDGCLLRRYSDRYGVSDSAWPGERVKAGAIPDHPYIARDPEKCILCARCVRVCAELQGATALGLVGRGFATQVEPAWNSRLEETTCKACGQCIAACPVGALSAKFMNERVPAWRTEIRKVLCPYCGAGCVLDADIADGRIQRVNDKMAASEKNTLLCRKGFTGFGLLEIKDRLKVPMIKENGAWREAKWDEAMNAAADGLKKAVKEKGGKTAAVLGSPRLTNEALYLLQKIGRAALGTNNIGGPGVGGSDGLARAAGFNASTATREDIAESDLILVAGMDLEADHPAIAALVRQAAARGAKLFIVSEAATKLDEQARGTLRAVWPDTGDIYGGWLSECAGTAPESGNIDGLKELKAALKVKSSGGWDEAQAVKFGAELLAAKRPLVIADPLAAHSGELAALIDILLLKGAVGLPGAGLMLPRAASNAQGALDNGLDCRRLPGCLPVTDAKAREPFEKIWRAKLPDWDGFNAAAIVNSAQAGAISALLSWGDNGLDGRAFPGAFVVSGEWTVPSAGHPASVVFPAALFTEDFGSQTSFDRNITQAEGWRGAGPQPNWRVIADLAAHLGLAKVEDIKKLRFEIGSLNRLYADIGWENWGTGTYSARWPLAAAEGLCARRRLLLPGDEEAKGPAGPGRPPEEDLFGKFARERYEELLAAGREKHSSK